MSLRIISGDRRGAKLQAPDGLETRPLRDRVRESLFNILRPELDGAVVLDAFAGSGAVGLEAISNGARHATFVEPAPAAVRVLQANIAKLRYEEFTTVLEGKTPGVLVRHRPAAGPWSLLMLMPPYHSGLCGETLAADAVLQHSAEGAMAVCEVHAEEPFEAPTHWRVTDDRRYGVTRLVFLALEKSAPA